MPEALPRSRAAAAPGAAPSTAPRWGLLIILRLGALGLAIWALLWRADCAFVYGTCSVRNLVAYFTIESAMLFSVVTVVALVAALGGRAPSWLTAARVIISSYVVISGGVFALLMGLSGFAGAEFLVPMSSRLLHFVLPAFAILDLMSAPGPARAVRSPWMLAAAALVFPAGWAVVTSIRGTLTDWYPYFFISPLAAGGVFPVVGYCAALAAIIVAVVLSLERLRRSAARALDAWAPPAR